MQFLTFVNCVISVNTDKKYCFTPQRTVSEVEKTIPTLLIRHGNMVTAWQSWMHDREETTLSAPPVTCYKQLTTVRTKVMTHLD